MQQKMMFPSVFSALVLSMAIAMPTAASVQVVAKKQIPAPRLNPSVLPAEARWPRDIRFRQELVCGSIIYREWDLILVKSEAQQTSSSSEYGADSIYKVFEAQQAGKSKWFATKFTRRSYTTDDVGSLSACAENGVYQATYHSANHSGAAESYVIRIPFTRFSDPKAWDITKGIHRHWDLTQKFNGLTGDANNVDNALSIIDGIVQIPGTLIIGNGKIMGDSRPQTIDTQGALQWHTVPWYRDLNQAMEQEPDAIWASHFYRTSDGYVVKQDVCTVKQGTSIKSIDCGNSANIKYYRIRANEKVYTEISNADFAQLQKQSQNGYIGTYEPSIGSIKIWDGNIAIEPVFKPGEASSKGILIHGISSKDQKKYAISIDGFKRNPDGTVQLDYYIVNVQNMKDVQHWQVVLKND